MIHKKFEISSEHSILKEIILGNPQSFVEGEKINEAMRKYYGTSDSPQRQKIVSEYESLSTILKQNGVNVYLPTSSQEVPQQLAPRDIGFVLGDTFVVSNMKWQSRKNEIKSIQNILSKFKGRIVNTPDDVLLEGGNIIFDKNIVFVGVGLRTSANAVQFLQSKFRHIYIYHLH